MVDIFLISYNKAKWLAEGIENALAQGDNVKVNIIDNNSSDESLEVAKDYSVNIFSQRENLGLVGAIKLAINKSQSEYVMVCSAEDPLSPGVISKMIKEFKKNSDIEIVGTYYEIIDEKGKFLKKYRCTYGPELLFYDSMPGHFLAKKSVYEKVIWRNVIVDGVNGYNDWDFWLQCLRRKIKVKIIKSVGFKYRYHNSITTNANNLRRKFKKKLRNNFEQNKIIFLVKLFKLFIINPQSIFIICYQIICKLYRTIAKKSFLD